MLRKYATWTQFEDEILKKLAELRIKDKNIAFVLNRTTPSVRTRLTKLGFSKIPYRNAKKEEFLKNVPDKDTFIEQIKREWLKYR